MKTCVGIDIGGTTVKIGLFQQDGTLITKWEIPTKKEDDGAYILSDVAQSIKEELNKQQIKMSEVIGAGIGIPGPVMQDGLVEVCVNLGWKNKYPGKELSALLDGVLVQSGNDANVASLGEMWQGGAKGYKNVIMVTLGTGVGGGVILNEQIIAGSHGLGGEIGHIHVNSSEVEPCNCGAVGCLEQIASATGIVREAKKVLASCTTPSALREKELSAKLVLDAAKEGDGVALEIVETVCFYLGRVLCQLSLTVDPQMFVIGGGVSKAGTFFLNKIKEHYESMLVISSKKAELSLAQLGNDAGIYGAARLVLG